MNQKITVEQAFNNLSSVIDGIRFLPTESNRIQQALQLLGNSLQENKPAEEEKKEETQDGDES